MTASLLQPNVTVSSRIALPREALWDRVGSLDGANREMAPWLALRAPHLMTLDTLPVGVPQRCSLRGPFGVPLGPYPLCLLRASPLGGFLEQTRTPLLAPWQHERTLVADGPDATIITDALAWRVRGIGARTRSDALVAAVVRAFFEHRHRRLRAACPRRP